MSESPAPRLLLVDDHLLVREGLRNMIESLGGYQVSWEAETAEEAMASFTEHRPDLTLLDVRLPDGDGIECLTKMRSIWPEARIIVLSANAFPKDVVMAEKNGASAYITKTISRQDLAHTLAAVCNGKRLFPEKPASFRHFPLTPREIEVLHGLRRGLINADIAEELKMSEHTVRTHVKAILAKLEAADRTEAVTRAFEYGYLRPENKE